VNDLNQTINNFIQVTIPFIHGKQPYEMGRVLFFAGLLDESDFNFTEDYFSYKFNHDKRIYILPSLVRCIDNEKQH
jgi:hypothetical protein